MSHLKGIIVVNFLFMSCHLLNAQNNPIKMPAIPFELSWQNIPESASYDEGELKIVAGAKTDMFRDPQATYNTDNAPKLLFTPDSNFVFTAAIKHNFQNKWDAGALVLIADEANWVKFAFEKDYKGIHRVVSVVTKDVSDDCNSVSLSGSEVYYKVARAGKVITLYYSENGAEWFLVRHFQFGAARSLKVGFLAQSPTGGQCEVSFSNITYQAKKIEDPYTGN
jgi:regulation of enolase protein 1 (concanavalin A-like superfamily)